VQRSSAKAKGWVIDQFLAADLAGQPFRHAMGYELGERSRARRDAGYDTAQRTGTYPLIEWGWDRDACERYIRKVTGVTWPKSACTFCPFALCSAAGQDRVLAAYQAEPAAGVHALVLEHIAVALNPRQGLAAGHRLAAILAGTGQHDDVLDRFRATLTQLPWRVYEVRRVIQPRPGDPGKAGSAWRSVRAVAAGDRAAAETALAQLAHDAGAAAEDEDGVSRAWLRRRGSTLPATEHFLVACPAGPADKQRPGFAATWAAAAGTTQPGPPGLTAAA
jgi:hypothetical protein